MTTTYGIISDLHAIDIKAVPIAIKKLMNEEVNALVLNGDLFGERSGYDPQEYMAAVLYAAGKSNLETFVLTGSHEEVHIAEPVLSAFSQRFGNIINTLDHPKIEKRDHTLVFLSGSDWRAGNAIHHGYALEDQNESGIYQNQGAYIHIININDLRKLVSEPAKTIVFSHVPRRFNNPDTCVDMAEFWEVTQPFRLGDQSCPLGSVFPGPVGYELVKQGAPIRLKRENRGNEALSGLYQELGITKSVTGHFHESSGRSNDVQGNKVREGFYVPDLFYNASCLDQLKVGMVSVKDSLIAYENVDLKRVIK